jgi:hypothetical protein
LHGASVDVVKELEVRLGLCRCGDDALCEIDCAFAALGEVVRGNGVFGAGSQGFLADDIDLGLGVRGELVDGNDDGNAVLLGVLDVLLEVDAAFAEKFDVLGAIDLLELSARATMTTVSGTRPEERHLMLKKRSPPMVKSKPASVTTKPVCSSWFSSGSVPASLRASLSARTEDAPILMFAKGPACTKTGVPSSVCIMLGLMASTSRAVSAPPAPMSSQVTGSPPRELATTMRPRRSLMSPRSLLRARIAIHSLATEMSKPVSRVCPFSVGA